MPLNEECDGTEFKTMREIVPGPVNADSPVTTTLKKISVYHLMQQGLH